MKTMENERLLNDVKHGVLMTMIALDKAHGCYDENEEFYVRKMKQVNNNDRRADSGAGLRN
jgi:hypothetical protein